MAWKSYLLKLKSDPLLTKAITSGVLSLVADLAARSMSRRPLKSSSALHEMTIGLVFRAPVIHAFHVLLDNVIFAGAKNQSSQSVVLAKLVIDQILFAPLFLGAYIIFSGMLEDVPLKVTTRRIRKELFGMLRSNWIVWVPANYFSYAFVPLHLRVAWGGIIGLFWTTYLILRMANNALDPEISNSNANAIATTNTDI
jgi:Mpv17 / PMP22 family